jgi:tape measure domain-containing protein
MSIRVELELADGQFVSRILHAGESVEQFNRTLLRTYPNLARYEAAATAAGHQIRRFADGNMIAYNSIAKVQQQSRGFLTTLRDVTIILGLAHSAILNIQNVTTGWAGKIVMVNSEFERLNMLMRGLSTASDPVLDAANNVQKLRDFALDTPFSLKALTDGFVKLKATGTDPFGGSLQSLTDGVAAFGGSEEIFGRVILGVSQMSGKGVIQMEELRQQLGEAIPRATELMARAMGVSYGELVKIVSTGTLKAKESLQQLYAELDRTYGGTSQQMMRTFSGQLSQARTNLENFALAIGDAGYFDAVKKQLRDFNTFLRSDVAKDFARQIGQALTSVVNGIRSVVDWVVKFRQEIIDTAKIVALAWAGGRVISGVVAFTTALATARTQLNLIIATASAGSLAGVGAGATAAGRAFQLFGTGASFAAIGLRAVWAALVPMAPLLGALGLAIGVTASYFGLFSDKGKEAEETLKNFKAATNEQIKEAQKFSEAQAQQLETEAQIFAGRFKNFEDFQRLRMRQSLSGLMNEEQLQNLRGQIAQEWEAKVTQKLEQAAEKRRQIAVGEKEVRSRIAAEAIEVANDAIDSQIQLSKRKYDEEFRNLSQKYDREREEQIRAGNDITKLQEEFSAAANKIKIAQYDKEIAILDRVREAQKSMIRSGTDVQVQVGEEISASMTKRINELNDLKRSAEELGTSVSRLAKPENTESNLEKADQLLQRLKSQAADYRGEMNGVQGETQKLIYLLKEAEKFGDNSVPGLQMMIDQIVQAQEEVSFLQELLKGKNDLERDAANVLRAEQERLFEEQYGNLNDLDKLILKVNQGLYFGQGEAYSPMEKMLRSAREAAVGVSDEVITARDAMYDAFGDGMIGRLERFIGKVGDLASAFGVVTASVGNTATSFDLLGKDPLGSYIQRLKMVESGGNPFARPTDRSGRPLSSAAGSGQFTEATWMDFLREMRQDTMLWTKEAKLALRENEAVMTQAMQWKTDRDRRALERNGIPASERNLRASYMLGTSGGVNLLSSAGERMLVDVIGEKAMAANPSLQGMTVNDYLAMIEKQGFSANEGPGRWLGPLMNTPGNISGAAAADIDKAREITQQRLLLEAENARADAMARMKREAKEASEIAENLGKNEAALRKQIREGDFGLDNNPLSERYKKDLELARQRDADEQRAADRRKARNQAEIAQQNAITNAEQLAARRKEALARMLDPTESKTTGAFRAYMAELDRYVVAVERGYGRESEAFKKAQEEKIAALRNFRNVELIETTAGLTQKTEEIRRSLMAENQSRSAAFNEEISRLNRLVQESTLVGEERKLVEDNVNAYITARRAEMMSAGPIATQMREWQDIGMNMEQAMTGWMSGAVDQFAEFITTGKANFQDLANSIIKDIIKITLQWSIAKAMGIPGVGGTGLGKLGVGTAHSGGIIGRDRGGFTRVNPAVFSGAARFHTGGIVKKMGLKDGEVPIIAKKGEGVFTPEQMKALGSSGGKSYTQNVNISPNINVNATGGTEEQNRDLANQVAKSVGPMIKTMVVSELMQQRRPGNMFGN